MNALLQKMSDKALQLSIALSVQLDLTYGCNARCVPCYLDHDDHGERTAAEIKHRPDEVAEAGVFILTRSRVEIFLGKDVFDLLEPARRLMSWPRLYGRQQARSLNPGLREIVRQNRSSLGQYAGQAKRRGQRRSNLSGSEESRADSRALRLLWKCIGEPFCVSWSHLHRCNRTHARN
jgi:hypothetical protein